MHLRTERTETTRKSKTMEETPKNRTIPITHNNRNSSPLRRQKQINGKQEERMKLITKALQDWDEEISKLFEIETWCNLIRKAKKGSRDERRYIEQSRLQSTAKNIIEQIVSTEYRQKISNILPVPSKKRGGQGRQKERAEEFLVLALDYDKNATENVMNKGVYGEGVAEKHKQEDNWVYDVTMEDDFLENRCSFPVQLEIQKQEDKENVPKPKPKNKQNQLKATKQKPARPKPYSCPKLKLSFIDTPLGEETEEEELLDIPYPSGTITTDYYNMDEQEGEKTRSPSPASPEITDKIQLKVKNNLTTLTKSEGEISRAFPQPCSCPPLEPFMFEEIELCFSRPKNDKVVSAFGLTLTTEQLSAYDKTRWLEDANIDFYLEMIKDRNNRPNSGYLRVYTFQSYFYPLLNKTGYESVRGATEKDNIFEYDLVLIPIHWSHHWVLVVVNFNEKTLRCYDSMNHDNERHLKAVGTYLKREWNEVKSAKKEIQEIQELDVFFKFDEKVEWYLGNTWVTQDLGAEALPQQNNGGDCGVFCCQFAEYLSREKEFDFEHRHMPYFRKRMLFETLTKKLLIY